MSDPIDAAAGLSELQKILEARDWAMSVLPDMISRVSSGEFLGATVTLAQMLVPGARAVAFEWSGSMRTGNTSIRTLRGHAHVLSQVPGGQVPTSNTLLGAAARTGEAQWYRDGADVHSLSGVPCAGCIPIGSRAALYLVGTTPDAFDDETRRRLEEVCRLGGALLSAPPELPSPPEPIPGLVGTTPRMEDLVRNVRAYAEVPWPVLILGETGTGKEAVARALHQLSGRTGPFVPVNCASFTPELAESHLFGHERGAFTGADRPHRGYCAEAEHGTLFLDEVGDLPAVVQPKLLRVLQERTFRTVGGSQDQRFSARVLSATHKAIDERSGSFRRDLLGRLGAAVIRTPPLRERRDDIPLLSRALLERIIVTEMPQAAGMTLTDDAMRMLEGRDWPGNVRQLENAVRDGLVWARQRGDRRIRSIDLPPADDSEPTELVAPTLELAAAVDRFERQHILRAIQASAGNKKRAAARLGITRQTLHARLRRWNLASDDEKGYDEP